LNGFKILNEIANEIFQLNEFKYLKNSQHSLLDDNISVTKQYDHYRYSPAWFNIRPFPFAAGEEKFGILQKTILFFLCGIKERRLSPLLYPFS
jgi:hypothetical protein